MSQGFEAKAVKRNILLTLGRATPKEPKNDFDF